MCYIQLYTKINSISMCQIKIIPRYLQEHHNTLAWCHQRCHLITGDRDFRRIIVIGVFLIPGDRYFRRIIMNIFLVFLLSLIFLSLRRLSSRLLLHLSLRPPLCQRDSIVVSLCPSLCLATQSVHHCVQLAQHQPFRVKPERLVTIINLSIIW